MATVSELIARTRLELADVSKSFVFTTTSVGATTVYDIPRVESIDADSVVVRLNGNVMASADYVVDTASGIVTITGAPPADGDTLQFSGSHHKFFSDEVMTTFVNTAFELHTTNRPVTMQALPANEVYLVALLAKIEALWVLVTDAAYDIDIRTPEGVSVPRTQRYAQLMALIQATQEQYKDLAMALGVGLYRIEMFTLRRVSRTTGRYVPVYLEREFDDTSPPVRVMPPIDTQFAEIKPDPTPVFDILIQQGQSFSRTFEIANADGTPRDLSGFDRFEAYVFKTKFDSTVVVEFDVTVDDPVGGVVTISKGFQDLERMDNLFAGQPNVWYLKAFLPTDEPEKLLRGDVHVTQDQPPNVLLR